MRAIIFQRENLNYLIVFFHSESVPCFFSIPLISIANLFAMRYLWDVCNEDKCLHQEPGQKPGQAFRVFGQAYQKTPGRPGKAWQAWPQPRFLGNLGHQSLAYLALLLPRPTFLGNPGQKSPAYNPGLKDSSHAWPGFFEFPGQKFIPFSDCNMKPQNLWPFVVPWRTLFSLQLLFFHKEWHIVSFHI